MYTKDKCCRITLRLNQDQFDFVKMNADMLGCSPSEFLRMVVNAAMITDRKFQEKLTSTITGLGGLGRENDKANIDDKL